MKIDLYDAEKVNSVLKERLSEKRYNHSIAVAQMAQKLASDLNVSQDKAYMTALVHDITKDTPLEIQLQILQNSGIILSSLEKNMPQLWHAISGAEYVKQNFTGIDDEVIDAIRYHTTAKENMSLLCKIVYIADCVSDDRSYDGVEKLREMAFLDINKAIVTSTRHTISMLCDKQKPIHIDTYNAYNYYLQIKGS
ncbi:MAG: bis(5'-nucleosyl)-tetraphosphatase (symmetrical) YqeK [Oscillospiraceae bacterium]|nr:bis(5'-nucleosyl)-tetraphosphatase (symmetrical) YqeK [Oscillospiraceae bacterium]